MHAHRVATLAGLVALMALVNSDRSAGAASSTTASPGTRVAAPAQRNGGRQRPPEATGAFTCDRNNLTVYTGVVTSYRRHAGETSLRIHTDENTNERVLLKHPGTDDPSARFRMNGEPFTLADWTRIESRKGVLRDGTRASAWVCEDGQVLVDWGVRRES